MKDNTQPTNVLEENSNEVTEQIEEAQDLVVLTNSVSSSFLDTEELDPITKAIRQEILKKQRNILKEYIVKNHDLTVIDYDDQEFAEYLKNINNRAIIDQAFANSKVKAELEKTEIAGYKKVHHNFADQFHTMNWQDGDRQGNVRSQIVRNDSGDELATIKETTHKINALVSLSDGTLKQINNYRTIDFPTELPNKTGSMHLSLAVKDENGRNIALDRAVYFTAHYDSQGKLSEISSPKPVRFNGEGDEAIGYIEHLGQVYSLPVTQGKYREMMLVLEKNKGQEINLSQSMATAQDMMITANAVNSYLHIQQEKKEYNHDRQKLAEEKLTKIAKHYRLGKEQAKLITKGLQYVYNHDNVPNKQIFEQQAEQFKLIHDLTPQQAIAKYQAILDELQPETNLRDQQRKLLHKLAERNPGLASNSVARHYTTHAAAYQQEKTTDANSTALEELEDTVKICGGYEKLGLTPLKKQLPEFDKIRQKSAQMVKEVDQAMPQIGVVEQSFDEKLRKLQLLADKLPKSNPNKEKLNIFVKLKLEEQESIKTGKPLPKSKERDEFLARKTEAAKKTERMIGRFMSRDSPSNKALPLNTSKLQLKNTQINKG
ncbi:Sca4 family protein [Rickettsia endosymbiont of Oedothorax gibbosus]|uniref:Sca4 family protein n=1 Tax=Rickettsia endosymbiont of Oedothorax gibbosus TaxID=931099 RepID=UPI002023DDE1|nr:Sca4 family protein [Rickettsia endosymbiont of Oedothorax gibbosus]